MDAARIRYWDLVEAIQAQLSTVCAQVPTLLYDELAGRLALAQLAVERDASAAVRH